MEQLGDADPERVGPYEILAVIGSGGMGKVYLGRDEDGVEVAVKVIHADLARSPEFRARFRREVAATRAVAGPHVAQVVAAGGEDEHPWLATEYVPGPSLHAVVAEKGPLPTEAVRALGAQLAEALGAIHAAGLVHRDVKPPNVLLAEDGPKLIDFGIARNSADSTMTRTGIVLGTPQFMAPEQLRGQRGGIGRPPTSSPWPVCSATPRPASSRSARAFRSSCSTGSRTRSPIWTGSAGISGPC